MQDLAMTVYRDSAAYVSQPPLILVSLAFIMSNQNPSASSPSFVFCLHRFSSRFSYLEQFIEEGAVVHYRLA
jgi:hypothetical protein